MNERIKELAEQARLWAVEAYKKQNDQFTSHWDNPIGYTPTQFFEQKFAELIVQECVAICEDTEGDPSADSRWGRRCCAVEIREHFGVEE